MGAFQIVLLVLGGLILFFVLPMIVAWIVIAHKVYARSS